MVPIKTRFTEQVGIEYPIICGAMYPCSSPDLVASVSEAGGIGIVMPISFITTRGLDLREALRYIRSKTDKPYGFNVILMPGYEERLMAWVDIALEEGCRFFITALGKPTWVVEKVHAKGGFVYHDVIKKEHALKGIEAGVDGLICVNKLAGGHAGYMSPQELYDDLKEFGKPLICAGSVGDEHDFVNALKIGFDGVQMATRFIATFECDETDAYKQAIINATEEDIVFTNFTDGVPGNALMPKGVEQEKMVGLNPLVGWLLRNRYTKKFMRKMASKRAFSGKELSEERFYSAGKSVGRITKIEHVKDIIDRFIQATKA